MNFKPALAQLAKDKQALESRIRDLIGTEVAAFSKDSGVGIESIAVRVLAIEAIAMPTYYSVCGVTVALDLG